MVVEAVLSRVRGNKSWEAILSECQQGSSVLDSQQKTRLTMEPGFDLPLCTQQRLRPRLNWRAKQLIIMFSRHTSKSELIQHNHDSFLLHCFLRHDLCAWLLVFVRALRSCRHLEKAIQLVVITLISPIQLSTRPIFSHV
jgi:hypothetical protein